MWRVVAVTAGLIASFFFTLALLVQEEIKLPQEKPVEAKDEPLRHVEYREDNRRTNLKDSFGMSDALADRTAKRVEQAKRSKAQLQKLLKDHAELVSDAFCPSDELPQPYAALEFLVYEQNARRDVFAPDRMLTLESQEWYLVNRGYVSSVYNQVEMAGRRPDATLMGISGVLLMREADVLEGNSPWSFSAFGTWGFARLAKEQPSIEALASEYFALMYFLTELANAQGGICT